MSNTTIRWTNHRNPKMNGKTAEVDEARAKVLVRDGLAARVPSAAQAVPVPASPRPAAPAVEAAALPADKPKGK